MVRHWLGVCPLAALLPVTASLRVSSSASCSVASVTPPRCDFPRYTVSAWTTSNGASLPDYPVLFENTGSSSNNFQDKATFLSFYGNRKVVTKPEYANDFFWDLHANSDRNITFNEFMQTSFRSYSDLTCKPNSICYECMRDVTVPEIFDTFNYRAPYLRINGPGGGVPLHKSGGNIWRGVSGGRTAWYAVPPGSLSETLHDLMGPFLFPVRAYHKQLQDLPLQSQPLFCEQQPGEVVFIPAYWWQSNMNLDDFQAAFGERIPKAFEGYNLPTPAPSSYLSSIYARLPLQAFDSGGYSSSDGSGKLGRNDPMPYSMIARKQLTRALCLENHADPRGLETPLLRMRQQASSPLWDCGLEHTVAFTHCHLATYIIGTANACRFGPTLLQSMNDLAESWREQARSLSPTFAASEEACQR